MISDFSRIDEIICRKLTARYLIAGVANRPILRGRQVKLSCSKRALLYRLQEVCQLFKRGVYTSTGVYTTDISTRRFNNRTFLSGYRDIWQ
ncbi:hypothetical protein SAMN05216311_11246 [Chitinophaga sp. CF418]|nr:hypothetical protein SAMN05216311_11246 [Chitinophaga sp. CF418]